MGDEAATADLMRVKPDDPAYLALAAAEAEFWSTQHPIDMEVWEMRVSDGPADRHANLRFTDDAGTHWYDTLQRYGDFRRGLILGTSGLRAEATILRLNPRMDVTFIDISAGALDRRTQYLGPRFPDRIATQVADFNFLDLEPRSWDVIISSASIHHVSNLEHLASQINSALTDDGLLFLNDYIGERRFEASAEKQRVYQVISDRDCRRNGMEPIPIEWIDDSNLSPLCGVRSDDIADVFAEYLLPERVRTAGALTIPLLRSRRPGGPPAPASYRLMSFARKVEAKLRRVPDFQRGWIDPRFYAELTLVGDTLADAGAIPPGNIFGVYRKRPA